MQSAMPHSPRRDVAVLGLVEALLSFAAIYAIIHLAGTSSSFPGVAAMGPGSGLGLAVFLTLVTAAASISIGLYRADAGLNRRRLLIMTGISVGVAGIVLLVVSGGRRADSSVAEVWSIAEALGAWLAAMTLIRLIYGPTAAWMSAARRILIIGDARHNHAVTARLRSRCGRRFDPVLLHAPEITWALLRQHRIWAVVLTSEPEASAISPLLDCKLRGTKIFTSASFHENYLGRIDLDSLSANDLLFGHGFTKGQFDVIVKRATDVVLGCLMLLLTLPLMVLTAAAIKIDSPGPVFYRQQRIGHFDKPFTLFKFRSMTVDAEAGGSPRWAQKRDPRVTRIGGFIRMSRIDELPQLANVIWGEMSLVGPRPERPHFVEQLARVIPFYRQRSYAKPGLSGSAQVNFPYGASVEDAREKLAYDLYYVKNQSLLLDAVILLSTLRVVLFREGAR